MIALEVPVVQAPMAGGPSTPALAAAVSEAGGLGTIAAGYRTLDQVAADVAAVRGATSRPFGLNLLVAAPQAPDAAALAAYRARLEPEAARLGVALGEPREDDDARAAKVALAVRQRVAVVSFAFGLPSPGEVAALHDAGAEVWVTATEADEARAAQEAGADAVVLQGVEAGGHRGSFGDADGRGELPLDELLRAAAEDVRVPLVAAGGLMDGADVARVLRAGAAAAQLGTAFLRCPEAGTSAVHREALERAPGTALTRAFSGRRARGLVNRFVAEHGAAAPAAYPHVHHMTAPLRAAGRAAGDGDVVNMWAGEGFRRGRDLPAGELVRELARELAAARR